VEIHGNDIIIDNWNRGITVKEVIDVVRNFWKDLAIEDDGDNGYFIYENWKAKEAWDKKGWSEINDKTMVYVIFSERGFTIVIDDNKENMLIAEAIKSLVTLD